MTARCPRCDQKCRQRSPAEIIAGSALHWSHMTEKELRTEHEILRRALETAKAQIALWSPIVARSHSAEPAAAQWAKVAPLIEAFRASCRACDAADSDAKRDDAYDEYNDAISALLAATEATP